MINVLNTQKQKTNATVFVKLHKLGQKLNLLLNNFRGDFIILLNNFWGELKNSIVYKKKSVFDKTIILGLCNFFLCTKSYIEYRNYECLLKMLLSN